MRFTASVSSLRRVLATAAIVAGSSAVTAVAAADQAPRVGACGAFSTDPADFPRAVPLPGDDYTVRGYLRADCKQVLDLAMDTDDLDPVQSDLVRRLRAKGFHGVTSASRTVEVDMGPESEPEQREEFVVRARGRGLRLKVELSFVGAAPRWSGTALVHYTVRPR